MLKYHEKGIVFTINDGKPTIDQPTVSFKWKLSKELCLLRPQYLFLVIQNSQEIDSDYGGERYLVKTSDLSKFLQFHRGGTHRITTLLLANSIDFDIFSKKILEQSGRRVYVLPINTKSVNPFARLNEDKSDVFHSRLVKKSQVLLAKSFEIEIPDGVFAAPPKKGVVKFLWDIVNTGWKYKPTDQCEMRKRTLISILTPHFTLLMVWRLGFLSLWSFLQSASLVFGRILIFFFGFLPKPIFMGVGMLWRRQVGDGEFIFRGFFQEYYEEEKFELQYFDESDLRVWSKKDGKKKKVLISPILLLIMIGVTWNLISHGQQYELEVALPSIFFLGMFSSLIYFRAKKPVSLKQNWSFWGKEVFQSEAAEFKHIIYLAVAGAFACLLSLPYYVGLNRILGVFLTILVIVVLLAVFSFLGYWIFRLIRKQKEKREKLLSQLREEKKKEWDLNYDNWLSTYGGKSKLRLSTSTEPCDICEDRTFMDKIRLFVSRKKPDVCRPYSA